MTAFLFLQKFEDGKLVFMPYQSLVEILSRYGKLGRGRGDWEITLPAGETAASCTVVGDAENGILCIGFERPAYNDTLRKIVWECMMQANCAVFDDSLDIVCTCLAGKKNLPKSLREASYNDVREISSELQLWPNGLEFAEQGSDKPILKYTNRNPNGANFQYFDYAQFDRNILYINIDILPEACNQGTLRVLFNLELRVDAARSDNPEYSATYVFTHQESSLSLMSSPRPDKIIDPFAGNDAVYDLVLKLPKLDKIINPAIIMQTMFVTLGNSRFYADRELFAKATSASVRLTQHVFSTRKVELEGSVKSIPLLSALLDDLHQRYSAMPQELDQEDLFTWVMQAGCYFGTVMRLRIGGQWGFIRRNQHKSMVIRLHTGRICNPFLLVLDHIINGKRSSIKAYFAFLMRSDMSATGREFDKAANIPGYCQILLGESQFQSDGLPLENLIPRVQLDYSVASLHHLDIYLDKVILQREQFSEMCMMNLSLAGSAYLGEVIRSNTRDTTEWCWVNYADFARDNPDFMEKHPYDETLAVFIDSPKQTTYPLQFLIFRLLGMPVDSAFVYVNTILDNEIKDQAPENKEKTAPAGSFTSEMVSNINLQQCISTLTSKQLDYINISAKMYDGDNQVVRPFRDFDTLLKHGRVVWGYIVQANSDLFAPGSKWSLGVVVYDVAGKQSPKDLAAIASQLSALSDTDNFKQLQFDNDNPLHVEVFSIGQLLNSGRISFIGSKVPQLISDYPLHLATVCVERKHLPGNMLLLPYVPIVISDLCHGSAMIFPEKWWPKELLALANQKFEEYARAHPMAPEQETTTAGEIPSSNELSKIILAGVLLSFPIVALLYHFFSANMKPLSITLFVMAMIIFFLFGMVCTINTVSWIQWNYFHKKKK